MSHTTNTGGSTDPQLTEIRATCEEFEFSDGTVVSMVSDPAVVNAWIQSDLAVDVRP